MGVIFVTGTDTGVGKTLVCGLLLRFLKEEGVAAGYQKWVSTGGGEPPEDLATCLDLAGEPYDPALLDLQAPYRFQLPASPHLAAEKAEASVDPETIRARLREMAARYDILVVEGVGGLLVPLRRDLLLVDFLATVKLPALVVARSGLGSLNHTLLTLEALRNRRIPVLGVILSDSFPEEDEVIVRDNLRTIAEAGKAPVLGRLPWCRDRRQARAAFGGLGRAVLARMREID